MFSYQSIENRLDIHLACEIEFFGRRFRPFVEFFENLAESNGVYFDKLLKRVYNNEKMFYRSFGGNTT
jgi:hypothetical protein